MGYSNVAGDLNVYGTTSLSDLVVRGNAIHYGSLINFGNTSLSNATISNLTVTGNFIITSTNTSTTNSLSIINQGTKTALYVNQNEFPNMTYNVAEFWDHTQIAMIIDGEGNVSVHTSSSPGYAFTVIDGASIDTLTLGTPLTTSSGGTGVSTASANFILAGPTVGGPLAPTFRALVNSDLPSSISVSNVSGNGAALSSLTGANVVGNVAQATLALVVSQAAQPNITSVGLLSNLDVSNSVTTTNVISTTANVGTLNVLTISNLNSLTTNLIASTANVGTLNVISVSNLSTLVLTNNLYAPNAITTTNLYTAGITSNATNTIFNYDTLIIPFVSCTTINAASTSNVLVSTVQGSSGATSLYVTGNVYVSNALSTTNVFATNANVTTANITTIQSTSLIPSASGLFMNLNATYTLTATSNWTGNIAGTITSNLYTLFAPLPGITGWNAYGTSTVVNAPTVNGGIKFNQTGPYMITAVISADNDIKTIALSSNSTDVHSNITNVWSYCYRYGVGTNPSIPATIPVYVTNTSTYYYIDIETANQTDNIRQTAYTNVASQAYTGSYVIIRPV